MTELAERTLSGFAGLLASTDQMPAGGSSSAVAGALAAALVEMSSLIVSRRVEDGEEDSLIAFAERARALREDLLALADRDVAAGKGALAAMKQPQLPAESIEVPLAIVEASAEVAEIGAAVAGVAPTGVRTDAVVGVLLADAAAIAAGEIVAANLDHASGEDPRLGRACELAERAASARNRVWLPLSYRRALRTTAQGRLGGEEGS